jgi:hypothetical protein
MQKWLLFFKPIRIAPSISAADSFGIPFVAYMVLTIVSGLWSLLPENGALIQKMGARFYNMNLLIIVIVGPFFPLMGASMFHWIAKRTMDLEGSLRRLILLFYYAGTGKAVCGLLVFLATFQGGGAGSETTSGAEGLLAPSFVFSMLAGLALGVYSISVDIRLLMVNYSIPVRTAIRLAVYFGLFLFLFVLILSLGIAMGVMGHGISGQGSIRV